MSPSPSYETTLTIDHESPWLDAGSSIGGAQAVLARLQRMGAPADARIEWRGGPDVGPGIYQAKAYWSTPATEGPDVP